MAIWQAKSKLDARVSRRCLLLTSLMTTCAPLIARAQEATVPATAAGSARELTEQGLRNLIAFTRLLGYVRHFHPSDQAAAADWEVVAIEGMRRIESCEDTQRLAMALEAFFRPLAPTVQVFPSGMQPEARVRSRAADRCGRPQGGLVAPCRGRAGGAALSRHALDLQE